MKTIHKHQLFIKDGKQRISLPMWAVIRHVGEQNRGLFLWLEVETENDVVVRRFIVHGAGHEIASDEFYVGTAQMADGLVWHVYEIINQP